MSYTTRKPEGEYSVPVMSGREVELRLSQLQTSRMVQTGDGLWRYDFNQLASNDPIEDNHLEEVSTMGLGRGYFWGVFDGHSGVWTSAYLSDNLARYVKEELGPLYEAKQSPTSEVIDSAIKRGFLRLDHDIVHAAADAFLKIKETEKSRLKAVADC